ncbi:UDP-2,4-diacetamido-2,4,6-trideoxy-beta-L-altropyranose hydrolase [Roseinatronobacter alkalisoli]|uniref:UDP-2,4-diacetamido-2,4, 6-trideoxy-beta-L-altropyranose hydrolase n=1 Tax=Roseinatronobacter alkalisoli TaxID=3028235 RepID=A0ABT5T699_9RHOB|nr:UDP-2,4-diacetamido-2,4,6-trideoxy-beta-L-altropyranose hydrolase [Roseinatronobacter sp. HJB301]MDD7970633.1 UDP-2,4-diacetamido-2,4,6-trideoxy-beta-L-altropyranose hydrolase [Roseinatronobacter sp. HJB301]
MRVIIRADASGMIGGGHMMRCLSLAQSLRAKGDTAAFVMAATGTDWTGMVTRAGFAVYPVAPRVRGHDDDGPWHQRWLSAPWQDDAKVTAQAVRDFAADWLIWDHYGLDARWVHVVRQAAGRLRVMAIDDLDDRALGSDLVLDQTRLDSTARTHPAPAPLSGPAYATLRPEFAALRAQALARRAKARDGRHVLVTLGLADAAGLAPDIVATLAQVPGVSADIVMGASAQTLPRVRALCAEHSRFALHVDTQDMAGLMLRADLCIGAGGMTSWERCCLGLATLLVPVAENQTDVARALAQAGAVQVLEVAQARNPRELQAALHVALAQAPVMGQVAAGLCDGLGTQRVVDVLGGELRAVTPADARLLFDWRNQPHIRAASLNTAALDWQGHLDWIAGLQGRTDGVFWVYTEGGRDLGHVNARRGDDGIWRWGFYIGADDAPKGAGRRMLALALVQLFSRPDCAEIEAEVRADNPRSVALHRALSFRQMASRDDGRVLVFSLNECDIDSVFSIQFPKDPRP